MTQSGDPRDNAIAERANGTLKNELLEDVYPDVQPQPGVAITRAVNTYNYLRPHSSLDMLTPAMAHSKINHLQAPLDRVLIKGNWRRRRLWTDDRE